MIRDVAELRDRGRVERRVDELDVDVATWQAGMRRAARREGMRIRTFLVEPAEPLTDTRPDPGDTPPPGTLVFAVRTDLPVDRAALAAAANAIPAPMLPPLGSPERATVTELSDVRARRSGHPCIDDHDS